MDWNSGSVTKKCVTLLKLINFSMFHFLMEKKKKTNCTFKDDNLYKQFARLVAMHYIIISIFLYAI